MIISLRPRFGRGRVAFAAVAVSVLVSGATSSVGATPLDNTPTNGVDDSPEFDIEKVPEQVLDDDTVLVTDAGIIIDEPEPFAGWPAEIVAQSVEAADPEDSANADGSGSVSEAPTASQAFTLHSPSGSRPDDLPRLRRAHHRRHRMEHERPTCVVHIRPLLA